MVVRAWLGSGPQVAFVCWANTKEKDDGQFEEGHRQPNLVAFVSSREDLAPLWEPLKLCLFLRACDLKPQTLAFPWPVTPSPALPTVPQPPRLASPIRITSPIPDVEKGKWASGFVLFGCLIVSLAPPFVLLVFVVLCLGVMCICIGFCGCVWHSFQSTRASDVARDHSQ